VQQPDSAIAVMQMAEKRFPDDDNVFLAYGNIAFAKKDTLGAIARYEKAVELNPFNVTAIDKIANLCGMTGQYEKSNAALNKITGLQPQNSAPYAIMTTNYLRLGDTAMARKCSDKYRALGGR
jgi:Flp pilus assembly protein TadD